MNFLTRRVALLRNSQLQTITMHIVLAKVEQYKTRLEEEEGKYLLTAARSNENRWGFRNYEKRHGDAKLVARKSVPHKWKSHQYCNTAWLLHLKTASLADIWSMRLDNRRCKRVRKKRLCSGDRIFSVVLKTYFFTYTDFVKPYIIAFEDRRQP